MRYNFIQGQALINDYQNKVCLQFFNIKTNNYEKKKWIQLYTNVSHSCIYYIKKNKILVFID